MGVDFSTGMLAQAASADAGATWVRADVRTALRRSSGWYWALLGFDLAMRLRNAVWHPPLVMYYRTCPPHAVRADLTSSGFTVTTAP
jgi:hypothetical protein